MCCALIPLAIFFSVTESLLPTSVMIRACPDVAGQDRIYLWSSGLPIGAQCTGYLTYISNNYSYRQLLVYLAECSVERARAAQCCRVYTGYLKLCRWQELGQ
jgi:hypothetical protein